MLKAAIKDTRTTSVLIQKVLQLQTDLAYIFNTNRTPPQIFFQDFSYFLGTLLNGWF